MCSLKNQPQKTIDEIFEEVLLGLSKLDGKLNAKRQANFLQALLVEIYKILDEKQ